MSITRINSLGITDGTIVNADINASAAIDSTKLTGVNDAKAWINFNGTGTPAIRASFNVTSITDNGTGDYTVNFTTALADANYAPVGNVGGTASSSVSFFPNDHNRARTTTAYSFLTLNTAGGVADSAQVSLAVFR